MAGRSGHRLDPGGRQARKLYAGGYGFFAISPGSGDIIRYANGQWNRIGGPGYTFLVGDTALYTLSPTRDMVVKYSGSGDRWYRIGGPARSIAPC
ncbi:hypothetical protein [Actinoplanes sp. HUAS TT8]|uniref:hypothetical protein n=1 Tax=Actinoplanes sp. HUAS TT8 TaxID=3447453 RepID=UPI003F52903F